MTKENKKNIPVENTGEKGDITTIYEVSYLLLPSLAPEQVPAKVEAFTASIVKAGGDVISGENPILIDLAYPMVKVIQTSRHKCHAGYFGWVKFEMTKDGIGEVKKAFDTDESVLRHLIVKTVRENTLLNGKMMFKLGEEENNEEVQEVQDIASAEVLPESSPEEIDKSIDDLVIA